MIRPPLGMAQRVLLVMAVLVLSAAAAVGGYAGAFRIRHPEQDTVLPGVPAAQALLHATDSPSVPASTSAAPTPTPAGVLAAIRSALTNPALGSQVLARVVDASTGAVLYDHDGTSTGAPASTAKLLTAAAILTVHPADYRFHTTVRVSGSTVYLVGGGDPTLSGAPARHAGAYPEAGRLSDLAADLRKAGVRASRIVVDDALFSGAAVSPYWQAEDVPSSYGAGITAVMTDGGRPSPSSVIRTATPDLAAGAELAALLGDSGLPVSRGTAPASATLAGTVASAPVSVLVSQMLQASDNVIADVLARQVAVAEHVTATFAGGAAAIREVLGRLGITVGTGMRDGSGLAASDRLAPATLVQLLRVIGGYIRTSVATQASALLAGLPVSGWSGTLEGRYVDGSTADAAGLVHAKTGSLSGVTSLAGYVHDRSGRLLIFSLDADRTPAGGTTAAEEALDGVVSALAGCGCG